MATTLQNPAAQHAGTGWVDALKGIGILMVVLGHALAGGPIRQFIYLFHMPLFFFISGYLHTPNKDFRKFAYKKSLHLLFPYFSILLLFYSASLAMELLRRAPLAEVESHFFDIAWGGYRLKGAYQVLWFLTCLFLTKLVMNFLMVKFRLRTVAAIAALALLLSYASSLYLPWFRLPLDAHVVFAAIPPFLAGYLWRRIDADSWWIAVLAAAGVAWAIWLVRLGTHIQYDMKTADYGTPFLSLLLAICCIVCTIRVTRWICLVPLASRLLERLGLASMGIMLLHSALLSGLPAIRRFRGAEGFVTFLLVSAISYGLTVVLTQFSVTRAFLLGSEQDFASLRNRFRRMDGSTPERDKGWLKGMRQSQPREARRVRAQL